MEKEEEKEEKVTYVLNDIAHLWIYVYHISPSSVICRVSSLRPFPIKEPSPPHPFLGLVLVHFSKELSFSFLVLII